MSKRTKFGKEALNIMIRITFLVEENCMSSTIAGSIDAFSVANLWRRMLDSKVTEDLFAFRIVTADGLPVTANGGLLLQPHSSGVGWVERSVTHRFLRMVGYASLHPPYSLHFCNRNF
ncbi:hypothetical protein QUF80_05270 [Desulfococcaceae bacterium HSG8]|nr:hypothetical protein [Desulfococcaceae bacterium HSG8]